MIKHVKNNIYVIVFFGILILAAVTNPDQTRHQEAVKSKINALMKQSINENLGESANSLEQAGEVLGTLLGSAIIDKMVENMVYTDNYVILSTTKIRWEGESKVIGIGVFGNVFLSDQLDDLGSKLKHLPK